MERVTASDLGDSELAAGFVAVGQIGAPWGVRGEVKVTLHTDFPERLVTLETVYLGPTARPIRVLQSRLHKGQALLMLEGYGDRTAAEALRGLWVQIPEADVVSLPADEHYVFEIIGMQVFTTAGEDLGRVIEVLFTGANEVFVVEGTRGQVLIPYIGDVVVGEDFEAGKLTVEPIPGLLD